jgi:AcrR family transcriptional regulator
MTDQSVINTRRRRPEARPSEIIDAALGLFARKGFDATRMDDVARAAGLSKGTIYLYFPDKTALLKAIITKKAVENLSSKTADILASAQTSAEALRKFLALIAFNVENTDLPNLLKLVIAESRAHPEIGRFYLDSAIGHMLPKVEHIIAQGIARGEFRAIAPALAARSIVGPMLFAALWKAVFEPVGAAPINVAELAQHHADIIIRGLAP